MFTVENVIALVALACMEIVLGIDNIVFLAVVSGRLPKEQQSLARRLGLLLAMAMRILLLLCIAWIMGLDEPIFELTDLGVPESLLERFEHSEPVNAVSWRDLILLAGGLFLIYQSVREIHAKIENHESEHEFSASRSFASALFQIAVMDLVFSLDSVITAVGMVDSIPVMVTAIVLSIAVMMLFANQVSDFVSRHPTITMLALSFLILIGVMLVAEGLGTHIDKNYIYFAMAFALGVEFLNLRMRTRQASSQTAQPEVTSD